MREEEKKRADKISTRQSECGCRIVTGPGSLVYWPCDPEAFDRSVGYPQRRYWLHVVTRLTELTGEGSSDG